MKANHFSIQRSRIVFAATLLLFSAGFLFVSCEKENIIVQPPDVVTTVDHPDEVQDLVAWYNPLRGAFLVDPNYLEGVLSSLQAVPVTNGSYVMNGINLLGEPVTVHFTIEPVKVPEIYLQATATEAALTTEQPLTPDLIHTFTEKGTSYRVYKNAECGKVKKGFEGACEAAPDGTSRKRVWYEIRTCERGNGFCTEALGIQGRQVTYFNANCQGPVKGEEPLPGYMCWQ
ncbi:MAG: hypothetical protein HY842_16685 [Bacteroidetes bacterium]|nr:hypothetical protein [Bacteroidota bacterium]